MTNDEIDTIIEAEKTLDGDIEWQEDEDRSTCREFRAEIASEDLDYDLYLHGSYNREGGKLTFTVIVRGVGCIYRLDLGAAHRNPGGKMVGDPHKHKWQEGTKDKWAYEPPDITAEATEPVDVWNQFCEEFNLTHNGRMHDPPGTQLRLVKK